MRTISPIEPIGAAFAWTHRVLFRPFDAGKWFALGFCAFLAQLGQGGNNCNCSVPSPNTSGGGLSGGGSGEPFLRTAVEWAAAHLSLLVGLGLVVLTLILLVTAVLQWLSARGDFMFLDGVVRNQGQVVEPWRRYRRHGDNLFLFRFAFGILAVLAILAILAVGVLIALPDIKAETFGFPAFLAILVAAVLCLPLWLVVAMLFLVLQDFAVPIMYRRDIGPIAALRVFWRELLPGNVGPIILFYLLRLALCLAAGILTLVVLLVTCCFCCLALLPYLGSVILLPIAVFFRSYSLYFLAQFGPEWNLLPANPNDPPPQATAP